MLFFSRRAAIESLKDFKSRLHSKYIIEKESRRENKPQAPEQGRKKRSRLHTRLTLINGSLYFLKTKRRETKEKQTTQTFVDSPRPKIDNWEKSGVYENDYSSDENSEQGEELDKPQPLHKSFPQSFHSSIMNKLKLKKSTARQKKNSFHSTEKSAPRNVNKRKKVSLGFVQVKGSSIIENLQAEDDKYYPMSETISVVIENHDYEDPPIQIVTSKASSDVRQEVSKLEAHEKPERNFPLVESQSISPLPKLPNRSPFPVNNNECEPMSPIGSDQETSPITSSGKEFEELNPISQASQSCIKADKFEVENDRQSAEEESSCDDFMYVDDFLQLSQASQSCIKADEFEVENDRQSAEEASSCDDFMYVDDFLQLSHASQSCIKADKFEVENDRQSAEEESSSDDFMYVDDFLQLKYAYASVKVNTVPDELAREDYEAYASVKVNTVPDELAREDYEAYASVKVNTVPDELAREDYEAYASVKVNTVPDELAREDYEAYASVKVNTVPDELAREDYEAYVSVKVNTVPDELAREDYEAYASVKVNTVPDELAREDYERVSSSDQLEESYEYVNDP